MSEVKFEPFQKALVRDRDQELWKAHFFSHFDEQDDYPFYTIGGDNWKQCLPYNNKTAHLLGTTDSPTPPEPEFKWGDKVEVRNDKYNDWKKALFCNRNGGLNMCLAIGDSVVTGWRRCRHADW